MNKNSANNVTKKPRATTTKIIIAAVIAVVVAAAATITTVTITHKDAWAATALTEKIEKIYTKDYQSDAAAKVAKKKVTGTYTADNMLVLENPYGTNTTSLYVYFTTDEDTKVTYTVTAPDTKYSDFTATAYQAKEYQTSHEFSVLGLIPNTKNKIIFTLTNKAGTSVTKTLTYTMGALLGSEEIQVKQTATNTSTKLGDGLYAILGNDSDGQDFMFYYDNNGILRGEIPILYYRSHRLLFRNDIMYMSVSTRDIVGMNRLGQIVKWYSTGDDYLLHHDYGMDSDGNLVVLATNVTKNTIQDAIIKIDGDTGKVTELVDMGDLYSSYKDSTEFATMGTTSSSTTDDTSRNFDPDSSSTKKDWIHLNTIQLLDDGSAIISSRETSTIIKLNDLETNPSINYMIGESTFWSGTDFSKYLLKKDTSDGDWPSTGGQHSVTYETDDSLDDGQYYLYMFNNNYGSSNTRSDYSWTDNVSGIQTTYKSGTNSYYYKYLVDENAGTYKLVKSFKVPYSSIVSSAQEYSDGTTVIDSGMQGIWGVYSSDGTLIQQYKMKVLKNIIYRVYKYDFKGFYFAK
ncbi:MAG: aryl-sulfate sulfotransferase [Bifidobacteriaceae bacterium]|jgi:hypothetical protein|nr:aryl-sulfate sulfotransferase [Bifidobacteriaceae bacterium]MCI1978979.1 aryl-sulfate sulfotransferase [Bifidobacteriaceae bacterium]